MLARDFAAEIARVGSGQNVTAVLHWRTPARIGASDSIADAKQSLIDDLGRVEGVRINPLPGFPQLIIVAPADVWRSFIQRNAWLQDSDQVEVVGNGQMFQIVQ